MNRPEIAGELRGVGTLMMLQDGREFELVRTEDVSGVSGIGVVADGIAFDLKQEGDGSGRGVVRWHGDRPSTVVWASIEDALAIHGHDGRTTIRWKDET